MDRTAAATAAISLVCDGTSRVFLADKEGPLSRSERPDRGLEPGSAKASLGGGSLPESPQSEDDAFPPDFSRGALRAETRRLVLDFYREYLGEKVRNPHPAMATMSRVVRGVIQKHSIAYNGMAKRLTLEEQDDSMAFVGSVAETLFNDGTTNWGRIASLVAFGAVMCEQLKLMGRQKCLENVAQHISTYLGTNQCEWLINNKGWDGFVEFFREDDSESRVRNALMAFAGVAGLGAGLALLMR